MSADVGSDVPTMASEGHDRHGDIVDPATGLPRVLARKCATCIYRPGNLMHLRPGRREEMQEHAVANGSWIVCHSTLPAAGTDRQAICRGFYDVAGRDTVGIRLAHALAAVAGRDWPACAALEPPRRAAETTTEEP